jgi:hypothetical protein
MEAIKSRQVTFVEYLVKFKDLDSLDEQSHFMNINEQITDPKRIESVFMKDFLKYHDLTGNSFEILEYDLTGRTLLQETKLYEMTPRMEGLEETHAFG